MSCTNKAIDPVDELSCEIQNAILKGSRIIGLDLLEDPKRGKFMDTVTGNDIEVLDIFHAVIKNAPVGLGEPVYDRLEASLANAMLSINASKGFEFLQNTKWAI